MKKDIKKIVSALREDEEVKKMVFNVKLWIKIIPFIAVFLLINLVIIRGFMWYFNFLGNLVL